MSWLWDAIARGYYFLYHRLCQLGEPFTRIFCRQEQAWPAFFWAFWGGLGCWCAVTINQPGQVWPWKVLAAAYLLFLLWFTPHIVRYRVAHPENKPYLSFWQKGARWAEKRLQHD